MEWMSQQRRNVKRDIDRGQSPGGPSTFKRQSKEANQEKKSRFKVARMTGRESKTL